MRSFSAIWAYCFLFSSHAIIFGLLDNEFAIDAASLGRSGKSSSTTSSKNKSSSSVIHNDFNVDRINEADEDDSSTAWDTHIRHLEHLLEADLERIGKDAMLQTTQLSNSPEENRNVTQTLTNDLIHVREDIEKLVQSVKAVERELGLSKKKIDEEEKHIQERAVQVETEKFMDVLHRGKAKVKVDYVTGQIVRKTTPKKNKAGDGSNKKNKLMNTNSTSTPTISKASGYLQNSTLERKSSFYYHQDSSLSSAVIRNKFDMDELDIATATGSDNDDDTEFIGVREHIESHPDIRNRVREEMKFLKNGSDPAVIKFDPRLMLDIVKLAITASLFGLIAVFIQLPPTAGFLVGGMLIGPSCLDLLGEIHQVRTLAQFGVIFLLFEQGLLYSKTYYFDETTKSDNNNNNTNHPKDEDGVFDDCLTNRRDAAKVKDIKKSMCINFNNKKVLHSRGSRNNHSSSSSLPSRNNNKTTSTTIKSSSRSFLDDDEHDPNIVGFILLMLLIFVALAVVIVTNLASSATEGIMLASTIALCSTTIISETMDAANIANTHWGVGVLKMMSIHDLFMVPLLALPQLLSSLNESFNGDADDDDAFDTLPFRSVRDVVLNLGLVVLFLKVSSFFATNIIRAANYANKLIPSAKGELFTLSVVAYALLIAAASEELNMSIEAGAVLAGIALYKSPHVPKVIASIQPITRVFGGMYLTSLGMIISPTFVLKEAGSILELVCLIGLFKLVLVSTVLHRFFDYRLTQSVAVGSAMAQISEFSLLVLAKSQGLGLIRRKTYLLFIPTVCILLTLAPFSAGLLRRLPKMQEYDELEVSMMKYLPFLIQQKNKIITSTNKYNNNNNNINHHHHRSGNINDIEDGRKPI